MREPKAILKKTIIDLQKSIESQETDLENFVRTKKEIIFRSKKIIERLQAELGGLEASPQAEDAKVFTGMSQTKIIQYKAKGILRENGGSMNRMELIKLIIIEGVKSRDPEQLIRRALARDSEIESVDDVFFYLGAR